MSVVLEQRKKKEVQSSFRVGEEVLISPQVTNEKEWIKGIVTEIEDNPFVGFVISVKTKELGMFFDKEYLFKKLN
ncbi:transcriptional regulator [Capnocytophaga gingivalis]|jgi:hypothetical protein|uniref:transcriptional regulator n=1 Tax=Capnocytophaga gingivalis TaxID=1017 RepID=UPI001CB45F0F|nr:transcriptional regulator [Capnocytophaga gingivalis]MBF1125647.1 transcriptional regulator [Capnocytophaga sp.]